MLRGLAYLTGGTALAQLVSFVFLLYLARLYDPQSFGELGVVIAASGVLATLVGLQMRQAVIIADTPEKQSASVVAFLVAATIQLSLALFASLGVWLIAPHDSALLHGVSYAFPVILLAASMAWGAVLQATCIRNGRYLSASALVAGKTIAVCTAQVALSPLDTLNGLVYGFVVGDLVISVVASILLLIGYDRLPISRVSITAAILELRAQKSIATFATAREALHTVTVSAPIWIIAAVFGATAAGNFAMATRLLDAPVALFGNAVRSMSLREFADLARSDKLALRSRLAFWLKLLSIGAGAMLFVVVVFGDGGIELLLGSGWAEAATFILVLVAWKAIAFCKAPASAFFYATARDRFTLIYQLWGLFLMVAGLVVVMSLGASVLFAVAAISVAGLLIDGAFCAAAVRLAHRDSLAA